MRRCAAVFVMLLPLCVMFGCSRSYSEPKPETHKVEGKVTYKDGKAFTEGGAIDFRHTTTEGVRATGEIDEKGTFILFTVTAQHKVPGAPVGTYEVVVIPKSADQNVQILTLQKKYEVKAGDNQLTIHVDD